MRIRSASTAGRESGYNLVVLMVAITVMNILIAASLPLWSRMIQHDKEEELVFRGLQYAEAIRVFRNRFQRAPIRLEELIESKPRCIRQLWKDPMTEDGKWRVLYENVQQPPGTITPQQPGEGGPGDGSFDDGSKKGGGGGQDPDPKDRDTDLEPGESNPQGGGGLSSEQKEKLTVGPIEGVASRSSKRSAMIWNREERYDRWQFRWLLVAQQKSVVVNGPNAAPVAQGESLRWIGRPWPKWLGIQSSPIPQPGLPGGGTPKPGSRGGQGREPQPPNGGDGGAFGIPEGLPPDPNEPPPS